MSVIAEIHKDLEQGMVRLMAEHRDLLFAEAVRLCNDASLAEDLVSRTFAKAIQKIDLHDEASSLSAWLKTILVNLYRDDLRNSVVRGTVPVDAETLEKEAGEDWSSDNQILADSDNEALRAAMDRLDPKYKQILVMHYFSELPVKAIALALNIPVGTVLWRLNIARKMLAKDLAEKLGKKKPLAVLLGALLLGGALFGAFIANSIFNDDLKEIQEDKPMNTLQKTMTTATMALTLMTTASADVEAIKTLLVPEGVTDVYFAQDADGNDDEGAFTYTEPESGDTVVVFASVGAHTFKVPTGVASLDYLVVAGGGSGGHATNAGGGGAGGLLTNTAPYAVSALKPLSITVGQGGAVVTGSGKVNGNNGGISALNEIEAKGGGAGGRDGVAGADGGSGGGAGGGGVTATVASGGKGEQGHDGGAHLYGKTTDGAGGGGAGGKGGDNGSTGGVGGEGIVCEITGKSVCYAGGGGGGCEGSASGGGIGGGCNGDSRVGGQGGGSTSWKPGDGITSGYSGRPGVDGLGGGGGGTGKYNSSISGKGGDGIVIIRYKVGGAHVHGFEGSPWQDVEGEGPTCTEPGLRYRLCINDCPDNPPAAETNEFAALGHDWGEWVVTKEPTYAEDGLRQHTCKRCRVTEEEPINHLSRIPADEGWSKEIGRETVIVFTNTTKAMTYTIPKGVTSLRYLVVGGGGSGGGDTGSSNTAGGGGAGGMLTNTAPWRVNTGDTLTITVGKGGAALAKNAKKGNPGDDSSLVNGKGTDADVIAYGGGAGGREGQDYGSGAGFGGSGGCGGGAGGGGIDGVRDGGTGSQGGNGGGRSGSATAGAGGGGAGGDGGNAGGYSAPGVGGQGLQCDITGENLWYAAGGAGGGNKDLLEDVARANGIGGKGDGATASTQGEDGTGSGGGGGGNSYSGAGKGGDGVVIIRYKQRTNGVVFMIY